MTWNPVWEAVHQSRSWGQYPSEELVRFVAKHYYDTPDRARVRMLEVGCGAGANLWFLAREGFEVHGLEGAPTAVRRTVARLDKECPDWSTRGGRVQVADMASLPYPTATKDTGFDAVLDVVAGCYSSLEQARLAYAEMARVTRPGGRLYVSTFAQGCWGEGTGTQVGPDMWDCTEGPLAGLGPTRFTALGQIEDLLRGWTVTQLTRKVMSNADGGQSISHWIIYAMRHDA